MSDSKTFPDVDQALFVRIKEASRRAHGTDYEPPSGNKGTATTKVPVIGSIVLGFDLDPNEKAITYTILSKPALVSVKNVMDGVEATIEACRRA